MPSPDHSISFIPGTRFVMPRFHKVFSVDEGPSAVIISLYANASWLAERLFDSGDTRFETLSGILARENAAIPGITSKQPSHYSVSRVPDSMNPAHFLGETMLIRVVWNVA